MDRDNLEASIVCNVLAQSPDAIHVLGHVIDRQRKLIVPRVISECANWERRENRRNERKGLIGRAWGGGRECKLVDEAAGTGLEVGNGGVGHPLVQIALSIVLSALPVSAGRERGKTNLGIESVGQLVSDHGPHATIVDRAALD